MSPRDPAIKSPSSQPVEVPFWQPALLLFSRLSSWIVAPVVIGILVGKWLDARYGTEPWLFLGTVGVAFVISMIGLVRDALREMDRINTEEKKDTKSKQ